jgi:hypothetical protein
MCQAKEFRNAIEEERGRKREREREAVRSRQIRGRGQRQTEIETDTKTETETKTKTKGRNRQRDKGGPMLLARCFFSAPAAGSALRPLAAEPSEKPRKESCLGESSDSPNTSPMSNPYLHTPRRSK